MDGFDVIDDMADMSMFAWDSSFQRFCHSLQAYRHLGMELHTFAAFVFEELPLDVLSFYLTVRYIMLEGRELTKRSDYVEEVRTQTYHRAREAVALVLGQGTEEEKTAFYKHLPECTTGPADKPLVIIPIFIRLLAEEYRVERKQRFLTLRNLVDVAFQMTPDLVEDPSEPPLEKQNPLRVTLEDDKPPEQRMVKSIRMEQMQSIVEALFPCRYEPKETVAFRLYRSACALGKGVVDAYSLRKAIEACGIQHTTLRVQIHLLTTANFGIVSDVSDKFLDFVREKQEEVIGLGALGPIPWLLEQVKPSQLAHSLPQMTTFAFTVTRMLVTCHLYFETSAEIEPGAQGRAGINEIVRLNAAYDSLLKMCKAHWIEK
jgi:hypothetical protein